MTSREQHVSPDSVLRLVIIRESDDITIGFDGRPWHTHGDVIAGELKLLGEPRVAAGDAAKRFVDDLLAGRLAVGVVRVRGEIQDNWASYIPKSGDRYRPEDEELEIRKWDGTPWAS